MEFRLIKDECQQKLRKKIHHSNIIANTDQHHTLETPPTTNNTFKNHCNTLHCPHEIPTSL